MPGIFKTQRRVEFCETDAAGIAHFAAFFPYMEQAEHGLLRHLGLSVVLEDEEGVVSWPRVSAHCDYLGAAKFEEILDITVQIEKLGNRSVTYVFAFARNGQSIAQGRLTAVCCRVSADKHLQSIEIPARMRELLERFWQATN